MRKIICIFLLAALCCLFSGCDTPDSLQMNLSQGYGDNLKLIHLNASTTEKREQMEAFKAAIENAQVLDKDFSLFAYYPDYKLEISPWEGEQSLTVIVDINGEYVDFYYPGPYPEQSESIFRSQVTAEEFKKLVHHS